MIPAVVLAAGKSKRMGRAKATLPLDERDTFITRIIRTLTEAQVEDIVVVLGHDREAIVEAVIRSDVEARFVVNADYESGQLSSLLAGINAIDRPGVAAMLMTLVDVPLVSAGTARAVIERYRTSHRPIVRPISGARHGHPIVIDRSLFDALRRADAASGAKPVVRAHASTEGDIEVDDEGAFTDIDTPDDYERFLNVRRRSLP